ncbi:MAG: hypothetical protein QOD17_08745 [Nitrososphaeraceae archaeon]|nr:hypothetical protein [Nitrososphaeraceae archaeon]
MEFVETIREDELANGTSKVISVKGKDIALFKIDNRITELGIVACIRVVHLQRER